MIELVHEGAATTAYSSVTDDSTFAHIVAGADEDIDAIVSGHTHLAYNHRVPVQKWIDEGRPVTKRPVVSAGQYGANLNRLEFEFCPGPTSWSTSARRSWGSRTTTPTRPLRRSSTTRSPRPPDRATRRSATSTVRSSGRSASTR